MHSIMPLPEILTVKEVATWLRVTRHTVYRMLADGRLTRITTGRSVRIPRASVEALLKPTNAREAHP